MLPTFPEFRKLAPDDMHRLEPYTSINRQYSTFNFNNLWAWDLSGQREISDLHGNLVIKFLDYDTGDPFLSFIGSNKSEDTVRELFVFAKKLGISPVLRYIAPECIPSQTNIFDIVPDPNNFEYVYSCMSIANAHGHELKNRRHAARKFLLGNPTAVFKLGELYDSSYRYDVKAVLDIWEMNKIHENKDVHFESERVAIQRMLNSQGAKHLTISAVFVSDKMIAFSIDEILEGGFALAHFVKADSAYKGIYEFINERTAEYLVSRNVHAWNWQQDLGIPGLRQLKMSYNPITILEKYSLSPRR